MDRVVSSVRGADQVLRVKDVNVRMSDVGDDDRVHVVNDDLVEDLVTFDS
jgi:hypothetical protein